MDYALAKEVKTLRRRVKLAQRNGPEATLEACETALYRFDDIGWPDDWSWFQRAADDARMV